MNKSNVEGVFDQAKGKVEQAAGEVFGSQKLANEGAADQVKGHVKEAWGNAKDTASNIGSTDRSTARAEAEDAGHRTRNAVTNAAASVKDSINRGLDKIERKH